MKPSADTNRTLFAYALLIAAVALMVASVRYTSSYPYSNPRNNERASTANTQTRSQPASPRLPLLGTANDGNQTAEHRHSKVETFVEKLADPIVWITVVIAFFAYWQVAVYSEMRDHTMDIERAYVTMSHFPPGFKLTTKEQITDANTVRHHDLSVRIRIENNGNTPAQVVFGVINIILRKGDLPDRPPYTITEQAGATTTNLSLAKGDSFRMFGNYEITTTGISLLDALEAQSAAGLFLYAIGYVDYLDKFGRRHRRGYGRMFIPSIERKAGPLYEADDGSFDLREYKKRNNLPFILKPGYNYDIEIDEQGNPKS